MPNEFKIKQSSAALMAALAAAFPLTGQAAGAARVDFAIGDVKALTPDGRTRSLDKGAEIGSGETIDTGSGRAQVRFTDGAQVSLQPQTQFRIDDYRFNGKADGSEKGLFSLIRGGLRTITGLVGRNNRDNYKVTTTVATIGIRGTEYSVAYGNSISVTTGEGSVEVCNSAGCLIVNSGETAVVKDNNSQPLMTNKKTELPPSQPDAVQPTFVSGNSASGGLPTLPSGPGYSLAMAGMKTDDGHYPFIDGPEGFSALDGRNSSTRANFDPSGALVSFNSTFDGGEAPANFTAGGVSAGALSDGIIGWGRWRSGSITEGSTVGVQDVHYVVGVPTPAADLSALQLGSMVGSYALSGFTFPTAYNSSTGLTTVGTQPVSGSMTADFGAGSVSGNINVPIGGNTYTSSLSSTISGPNFSGFNSWSCSGGCGSGGSSTIHGFFVGANASRAGLVYRFNGTDLGTINGAAVFRQTGLAKNTGSGG